MITVKTLCCSTASGARNSTLSVHETSNGSFDIAVINISLVFFCLRNKKALVDGDCTATLIAAQAPGLPNGDPVCFNIVSWLCHLALALSVVLALDSRRVLHGQGWPRRPLT